LLGSAFEGLGPSRSLKVELDMVTPHVIISETHKRHGNDRPECHPEQGAEIPEKFSKNSLENYFTHLLSLFILLI